MRLLNFFSLIAVIIFNVLANALPINNLNTGQISDFYPVLFTPAGYVFSIWGLIYFSLLSFSIYQLLPSQRDNPNLNRIGVWFIAANGFNAAWIFSWHYLNVPLSMVFMLGLLVSLLAIYLRLNIGRAPANQLDNTFYQFPFSVYLGWISVATIANFSILFYTFGWNGWGLSPDLWTVIVIVVGALLGIAMIRLRNEIAYPLVIVWAFAGILFKPESPQMVGTAAGLAATAILLFLAITLLRSRQSALVEARKNRDNLIR
jgi:translocator protein